ncbi:hypothetical protein [Pseudozobellia thermophila]|uniref:Uncharacterized protein n=1 Tax=Pseudozobellia thermophila TaxID=192903 RepID=A0A1M6BTU5_9FLAO|nr:hypothetical protein [Pseudozobellia thermophila]SHI52212.1 hypothetical protein SAMN04488513_101536 [Pseudozobellia thermophila]
MRSKGYKILIIGSVLLAGGFLGCSKDEKPIDGEQRPEESETGLPREIDIDYNDGHSVAYTLTYNGSKQISSIEMRRNTNGNLSQGMTRFKYDEDENLISSVFEDQENGFTHEMLFDYSADNELLDVAVFFDGIEQDSELTYDETNNRYQIDFDSGFTVGIGLDSDGNIRESIVDETYIKMDGDNSEKGLFHEANVSTAMRLWYVMLYYLNLNELYLLSKKHMVSIGWETYKMLFENEVRDINGYLLEFSVRYNTDDAPPIDYTIRYD